MTEHPVVTCSIPSSWKAKIERLAAERNICSDQILYEAIAQYLGEKVETFDSRLVTLEAEASMLRSQLATLSSAVQTLQQRLLSAASIFALEGTKPLSLTASPSTFVPMPDDDLEDEPDEILYDFMEPGERLSS